MIAFDFISFFQKWWWCVKDFFNLIIFYHLTLVTSNVRNFETTTFHETVYV